MIDYNKVKEVTFHYTVEITDIVSVGTDGGIAPENIADFEQLTPEFKARMEHTIKNALNADDAQITDYKLFIGAETESTVTSE